MCKQHEEAFKAMKEFLYEKRKKGESFTIWELEQYVVEKAKTTRIATGRSVRDWIEDAKERGKIVEIAPLEYIVG